ncbi:Methyltransferase domain-containing protein [Deinococcus reticulitermitis]|uniref:Methyltransferase domain-containing protein n=1 Tax=Deinococcus reticulitermitis TaxID=856736 RepID=A0A1H6UIU1_9DEIO|nr:class I SAM-dependent methyltransferase [Deinococcus reticulitermitis]SEI92243.1 Methyltransferase domain-containing protein [Deinococcus reticulitermitis]
MSSFRSRPALPRGRPQARTAWTEADGYLGMVGRHGHAYHRHLAVPAVLKLLDVPRGARVLDLGCGPGVLAPHLHRRGLQVTGLDASPAMIAQARRLHGAAGTFVLGDARRLPPALRRAPFGGAVFLFSLQDMDPLGPVLREAGSVLRPGGVLVAVLTQPCFRVPRASGWARDPARGLYARQVSRYLTPFSAPAQGSASTTFHRPLGEYVAALAEAGLWVDALRELAPTPALRRQLGEDRPHNADLPALLALRAARLRG